MQRGHESRRFGEAVDDASAYVTRSLYSQNLTPFFALFEPQQLLIIRFEDLISRSPGGWPVVLKFLGLPSYSQPPPNHTLLSKNVANQRPLSSCGSRVLWNEPTFYRGRFGIMANSRLDQRLTEIPTSARFLFGRIPGRDCRADPCRHKEAREHTWSQPVGFLIPKGSDRRARSRLEPV